MLSYTGKMRMLVGRQTLGDTVAYSPALAIIQFFLPWFPGDS